MNSEVKLKVLEGIGYTAAIMIAVGGIHESKVLDYFNVLGLTFAVIAIVRLMVMNVRLRAELGSYRPSEGEDPEEEN